MDSGVLDSGRQHLEPLLNTRLNIDPQLWSPKKVRPTQYPPVPEPLPVESHTFVFPVGPSSSLPTHDLERIPAELMPPAKALADIVSDGPNGGHPPPPLVVITEYPGGAPEYGHLPAPSAEAPPPSKRPRRSNPFTSTSNPAPGPARVRSSEEDRLRFLHADPYCGGVEDHRVFCAVCARWIVLRRPTKYALHNWLRHKQKHAVAAGSRAAPPRRTFSGEADRLAVLRGDAECAEVVGDQVKCATCEVWVRLETRGPFELVQWYAHKDSHLAPATIRVRPAYRTAEERRQTLVDDAEIREVEKHRVFCTLCNVWVSLDSSVVYALWPWTKHQKKHTTAVRKTAAKGKSAAASAGASTAVLSPPTQVSSPGLTPAHEAPSSPTPLRRSSRRAQQQK